MSDKQTVGSVTYKKVGSEIQVVDLTTLEYRPQQKVRFPCRGISVRSAPARCRIVRGASTT